MLRRRTGTGWQLNRGEANAKDDLGRLASEQGNATAQLNLGSMYANGDGVIQDTFIAHMWLNIGAANGNHLASESRDKIEQRMTREQIAEAQALARRCMGVRLHKGTKSPTEPSALFLFEKGYSYRDHVAPYRMQGKRMKVRTQ